MGKQIWAAQTAVADLLAPQHRREHQAVLVVQLFSVVAVVGERSLLALALQEMIMVVEVVEVVQRPLPRPAVLVQQAHRA